MRRAGVVWCALAVAGCGSDAEVVAESASSEVLYGPAAKTELTPFPSNRYAIADPSTRTGLRLSISAETSADQIVSAFPETVAQLNELDGFSTTGGIFVKLSRPIDPRGLVKLPLADPPIVDPVLDAEDYKRSDSPLLLVDIDERSPDFGNAIGIVPRWFAQEKDVDFLVDDFTLLAQPATPLRPGTRYAFAVTDALKAYDGTSVGPSAGMRRALEGKGDDYERELRAGLDVLREKLDLDQRRIVGGTVFMTASVHDGIIAMAKARRSAPPPATAEAFSVARAPTASDPSVRFVARFAAPEFRKPKPDAKWQLDESGAPIAQKTENLEVFLDISHAGQSGPRPVVIFQHGLGGDKGGSDGTAERLAELSENGVAVVAIDSPEHGSRGGGAGGLIASVYGFFGIDPVTQYFDIARARDNFRQMASDQLELVRFVSSLGTLDLLPLDASGKPVPDGKPDLDVSRLLYIGHSFGSVQGATIFALAPEIAAANWNVGGAGLMMLLRDSNLFSIVVKSLTPAGTPFGSVARFMAATQAIVDPGDPLNYARYATLEALEGVAAWKPRDVLLQEVVNDSIVPNSTSEALARAAGLGLLNRVSEPSGLSDVTAPVSANVAGSATGVICQFDRMEGGKTAEHGALIFAPEARTQYVEFFKTALAGPHASVKAPY